MAQISAQHQPGAMDALPQRGRFDAQRLGGIGCRDLFEIAQHEGVAVDVWQPGERVARLRALDTEWRDKLRAA